MKAAVATGLVLLTPWVLAAAAIAYHSARAATGQNLPARLASWSTAGRRGARADWGAAMRAELASIDDPRERRRFALGCAWAAVRTGWGRGPLLVGAASAVLVALLTFIASRLMLAGDRTGLLAAVLVGAPQLLFGGVALTAARRARSFRTGLEYGAAVLLASLLAILTVAIPESIRWYDEAGVWLLDGDSPASGIPNAQAAVQDALGGLTFFFLLFTTPWPVLGAYFGSHLRHGLPSTQS
ncbi:hypothetical protein AB0I34_28520 [Kribbella sp. NPDC050281]|uniref:hypothetical protein n=1 Tax=Kribbella sp. NPDC050281 TaxID=3155515 RepID=UPI00340C026D